MKSQQNKQRDENLSAGALLCPICCVEYVEIEIDFEMDNRLLRNVKALKCPVCQDEQFTLEQREAIEARICNDPPDSPR